MPSSPLLPTDPSRAHDKSCFGVGGMQTDDTPILATNTFSQLGEDELQKASLIAWPRTQLGIQQPLDFNGSTIKLLQHNCLMVTQKTQGKRLAIISTIAEDGKQSYVY
ncbi:hypothetical protein O1611_g9589 [Lasiodiplodia mahajangana]|uniref:Uncharacterized protein n=1 Tax=Lasiodiplodia mahajangana TaxID=1108764 RepID=A0ACC2J7W4_9PEZI|nr:hypothetical protein O1611_g9589 [Lasiodiplodia mahajangana]